MHSIILTVHNKEWLLEKVLEGIYYNTRTPYELIIVIDGCTDNSERVVWDTLLSTPVEWKLLHAPDVFETKANNIGIKSAKGRIIAWFHADLQVEPVDVIKAAIKYNKDLVNKKILVKGKRYNRSLLDYIFTYFMGKIVNLLFNVSFEDICQR